MALLHANSPPAIGERMNDIGYGSTIDQDAKSSPFLITKSPSICGAEDLSIALIGLDAERRSALSLELAACGCSSVREFPLYPTRLDVLPQVLEKKFDVILFDLDSDPDYVLELVENICANGSSTVMVYSPVC